MKKAVLGWTTLGVVVALGGLAYWLDDRRAETQQTYRKMILGGYPTPNDGPVLLW